MSRERYIVLAALAATFIAAGFFFARDVTRWWAASGEAHAALMARSDDLALTEYVRCIFTQPGCWADYRSVAGTSAPFPLVSLLVLLGSFFLGIAAVLIWLRRPKRLYDGSLATREDVADLRTRGWLKDKNAGTSVVIGQLVEVPDEGPARKKTLRGERTHGTDNQTLVVKPGYGGRGELPQAAVFGTTRSGKTMHLIAQALRWTGSFVALDVKGEIYNLTAGVVAKRAEGNVPFVLSPNGVGHQFDALVELMSVDKGIETAATIIAEPEKESGNGRYFAEKAAQGISAAFYAARFLERPPFDLLHEFFLAGGMGPFVDRLMALDDPDTRLALNAFLDPHGGLEFDRGRALDEGGLTNAWSTMTKALGPFLSREVRWLFRRSDFRACDLMRQKTYVYLQFPEISLRATRRVYDLIVTGLTSGMVRYADSALQGEPPETKVLLLLDELYAAPVSNLPILLATASSRYITPIFYIQSPAMLTELYGPSGKEALLENCGIKLFYKSETPSTWRYVSDLAGKVSRTDRRKSQRRRPFGFEAPTISEGNQSREVITPDEVDMVGGEKREVILAKVTGKPLALVRRVDTRPGTPLGRVMARHLPPKIPQAALEQPVRASPPEPAPAGAAPTRGRGTVRSLVEAFNDRDAAVPAPQGGSPQGLTQQPLDFPQIEPPAPDPAPLTGLPHRAAEPTTDADTTKEAATLLGGRSRSDRRSKHVRKVT